jgi:hypothetical protein
MTESVLLVLSCAVTSSLYFIGPRSTRSPVRSAEAALNVRHEFLIGIAGMSDDSVEAAIEGN